LQPHKLKSIDVDYNPKEHLQELKEGNQHRTIAWNLNSKCLESIIRVHETVNARIHHNIPQLIRFIGLVHDPPAEKSGNMMVPVQKDEVLFSQYNEGSVSELDKF